MLTAAAREDESPSPPPPSRPPRRWLAVILGLFVPGLGYFYAGRVRLAIVTALTLQLIPAVLFGLGVHGTPAGAVILLLVVGALLAGPAIHVTRICRHATPVQRSRRQSVVRYALFIALIIGWEPVVSMLNRAILGGMCVRVYKVEGTAMSPTLIPSDRIVADACRPYGIKVGSLALFGRPDKPSALMFKRVIAEGGDTVQITSHTIVVNNRVVSTLSTPVPPTQVYGPVTVDHGSFFVIGDNLANSADSRHFGTVHRSLMRGPALYVLWSSTDGFGRSLTPPRISNP